jgi:chromosome segregation ATPase
MSASTEDELVNSPETPMKRKNSITSNSANNVPQVKELIKIPYVKDLLVKMDILKNGIKSERNKNKLYENQIKQLENELNSKMEQIQTLSQSKSEIEKQLALEKKQLEKKEEGFLKMASLLNSSSKNSGKFCVNQNKSEDNDENNNDEKNSKIVSIMANEEVIKLNEEITQLKFDNETLKQRMDISLEENENRKLEYQTIIKAQTTKIKSLEDELKKIKSQKAELQQRISANSSMYTQSQKEREHYNNLLNEYKKGKEEAVRQLNACLEKCSKLMIENQEYKDTIAIHQSDATKMAEKLAEYKNMLIKTNLRNQMFHVRKLGLISNQDIDIYFGQDKDGNYVMRIDEKDKIELINIQDVDYITPIDIKKNKVQISYMYQSKKNIINVLVDDYVIGQFVETFKNFYSESVKVQNQLHY